MTYRFLEHGEFVHAEAFSVAPMVGLTYRLPFGALSAFAGVETRETTYEEAGRAARAQTAPAGAAELYARRQSLTVLLLYQFSGVDDFHWARASAVHDVANLMTGRVTIATGAEAVVMGNRDFAAQRVGGLVEGRHRSVRPQVTLGVGAEHFTASHRDRIVPYVTLNIYARF